MLFYLVFNALYVFYCEFENFHRIGLLFSLTNLLTSRGNYTSGHHIPSVGLCEMHKWLLVKFEVFLIIDSSFHRRHSYDRKMTEGAPRSIALNNCIFIQTGGQDVTGNILLSVPTDRIADLGDQSVAELTSFFLRMMEVSRYMKASTSGHSNSGKPPVAFLADLRQAPTQTLYPLVEVLEAVEHNQRGSIAAVYFLKPKSSSKSHILKKLLGLKPSKKRPRVPLFKIVLMKTIQELYTQIDMHHLTLDFSGTLKYSHHAWMYLYENIVQCIEKVKDLLLKLPSIRDRVDLLQEYEPDSQSSGQLQQLLTDLTEKYHHIISKSCLPMCLTRCKQTLFSLDNLSSSSLLSCLHPNLLSGFRSQLHSLFSELDQWNKSLEEAWRITEGHFVLIIQYNRHKEKAKEIEHKICDHYLPLLKEHPIVGRTLSQAELYRAHFTTTLYEPAKELLSQATEILEAMQKVKTSAASLSTTGVSSSLVEAITSMDISSISKHLTTSIQPFTIHMQQLQELYVSIHVFHLLFEKALSWYKKVLKFLPESLLHSWTNDCDISQSDPSIHDLSFQGGPTQVIYMPPEWLGAVRVFLDRHPPPREEHINRLDVSTPNVVDKKLRAQARSLALRLRLLQRVLSSTRLPLKLVMAVTGWKFELFGPTHSERSSGHANLHGRVKETARNSNFQPESDGESTAQDSKWVTSSNAEETRNESSGTTSQSKKSVYFDQTTTSSMKSSTDKNNKEDIVGKTDQLANRKAAIANRIQQRRNSKSLLRAKSVEFSFNSSSTDGSVFDYEKAVSRANQIKGHKRQDGDLPKIRSGPKSAQRITQDQKHGQLGSQNFEHVKEREDYPTNGPDSNRNDTQDKNISFYAEQNPSFNVTNYDDYPVEMEDQILNENYERRPDSETPSSGERYIGLSYRPQSLQPQHKAWSRYFSMDDLLQADQSVAEDEFESGIDTMDHGRLDPYDLLMKRIKAVSASDLPNFEKLKCVSTLIANSQTTGQKDSQQVRNAAAKLSFSTFDLRERKTTEDTEAQVADDNDKYNGHNFSENPVEAVVRMKQNLAKSMEDISTHQFTMTPDEGAKAFSKLEIPSASARPHRFLTESRMQPSLTNSFSPNKTYDTAQMHISPEFHNSTLGSPARKILSDTNEAKPSSDTHPRRESHSHKKRHFQNSLRDVEEREQESQRGASHSFDSSTQQNRKLSLSKPSNLSYLAGRTFISPSFLRPASSMRNLSSQGQENLTFDLLKSMNLESREDFTDSLVNNTPLEDTYYNDRKDTFSQENFEGDEDQNIGNPLFSQTKEDNKPILSSKSTFTRKFKSFEQSENGNRKPHAYPKRPWSISLDASAYPILHQKDEQHDLRLSVYNVDRLKSEAELACKDQEEVANSLRKTQQILEEEEKRRINSWDERNVGNDGDDNLPRRRLIQSESIDNGYGSWASKLVSAPSTSSEGVELENVGNDDWMTTINHPFKTNRRQLSRGKSAKSSQDQSPIGNIQERPL